MFQEIIISLVLGVVQGISEFLPISSTAHLLISSNLVSGGYDVGLSASNFIQFGTLLAILVYYKKDISSLFSNVIINFTNKRQFKRFVDNNLKWIQNKLPTSLNEKDKYDIIIFQLIIATIPLVISALTLRSFIVSLRSDLINIAIFLLFGGILITIAEIVYRLIRKKNLTSDSEIFSLKQVLIIGFFQSFAIFPGVSRSGSTLAGALMTGRKRKEGVYFSFLLSIPAIFLASIYDSFKLFGSIFNGEISLLPSIDGLNIIDGKEVSISLISLIIAFAMSYFVGMWCLKWLLKYLSKHDSKIFIYYRILLAILITFNIYF